jgi:hypothetical protein
MKASFLAKGHVCQVSDETLTRVKQAAAKKDTWMRMYVLEPLWREVSLTAFEEEIHLHLGSVDEEAANGGYCRAWYNSRKITLFWADLDDAMKLREIFSQETLATWDLACKLIEQVKRSRPMFEPQAA